MSLSLVCLRYPGRQWSLNGKSPVFVVSQTWVHFSAMSLFVYLGKSLPIFPGPISVICTMEFPDYKT